MSGDLNENNVASFNGEMNNVKIDDSTTDATVAVNAGETSTPGLGEAENHASTAVIMSVDDTTNKSESGGGGAEVASLESVEKNIESFLEQQQQQQQQQLGGNMDQPVPESTNLMSHDHDQNTAPPNDQNAAMVDANTAQLDPNTTTNHSSGSSSFMPDVKLELDHHLDASNSQPDMLHKMLSEERVLSGVDDLTNDMSQHPPESVDNELANGDSENSDAVAAVVAAVEQAVAAKAATPTSASSKPSGAKKPKSNNKTNPTTPNKSNANTSHSLVASAGDSSAQKRRKKDPYAPKAPLNGYLVYFNEERAEMRLKNPSIGFGELTKIIAAKWKELPTEDKQKYINEAEIDKERYVKEMSDYKKSDAYKQYLKENSAAKMARNSTDEQLSMDQHQARPPTANNIRLGNNQAEMTNNTGDMPNLSWLQSGDAHNIAGFDVPIFTEEFIEHSKTREHDIRQLRKEVNELEQQNGVLNKHIDSLKQSSAKIDADMDHFKQANAQMQKNLDIFRQTMLHCFSNTPLPNTQEVAQPANIDDYIMKLYSIVNNTNQLDQQTPQQQQMNADQNYMVNRNFTMHVKSIFSKINFTSLFENI